MQKTNEMYPCIFDTQNISYKGSFRYNLAPDARCACSGAVVLCSHGLGGVYFKKRVAFVNELTISHDFLFHDDQIVVGPVNPEFPNGKHGFFLCSDPAQSDHSTGVVFERIRHVRTIVDDHFCAVEAHMTHSNFYSCFCSHTVSPRVCEMKQQPPRLLHI